MRPRLRSFGARVLTALILPTAVWWVRRHERRILEKGRPLSEAERGDARTLGLSETQIDATRVCFVHPVPLPGDSWLPLRAPAGMALGSGIYLDAKTIPPTGSHLRAILTHEFVHLRQYEQLGGNRPFLKQYLYECLAVGYPNSPMEREAIEGAII